jgi:hypothetical protein
MTTKFELDGFYHHAHVPGGIGKLTGEIQIEKNGWFEGQIRDHSSISPEQTLRGKFFQQDGLDQLVFLKLPKQTKLANIAYVLSKPIDESPAGNYLGEWGAMPYKVSFDNEIGLFSAEINLGMCCLGDRAEINLYRK